LFLKNLGLGEAAKRGVGTGNNQLPDMSAFMSVKSNNGYFRLPNGIIIQWGNSALAQQTTTVVTLPISFPNAGLMALANKGWALNTAGDYTVGIQTNGPSSIKITNTGAGTAQQGIWWLALGY